MLDPGKLYIDPVLTEFSTGYTAPDLIGGELFPFTRVNTKSGSYLVFNRANWLMFPDRREPGTVANEVEGARWSSDTFMTKQYSLQAPVYDEERRELASQGGIDLGIDLDTEAAELTSRSLRLKHETRVAAAVNNTANYASGNTVTLTGTAKWSDASGGDPAGVVRTAMQTIRNKTGRMPNVMVMTQPVWDNLQYNPKIVARYSGFALAVDDAFRQLTGFDGRLIIAGSQYNAANNIDATENITDIWTDNVFLGYIAPGDGQRIQTFAKTFYYPTNGELMSTDRWREDPRKTDVVRNTWEYDIKIVSNIAGYLIVDTL